MAISFSTKIRTEKCLVSLRQMHTTTRQRRRSNSISRPPPFAFSCTYAILKRRVIVQNNSSRKASWTYVVQKLIKDAALSTYTRLIKWNTVRARPRRAVRDVSKYSWSSTDAVSGFVDGFYLVSLRKFYSSHRRLEGRLGGLLPEMEGRNVRSGHGRRLAVGYVIIMLQRSALSISLGDVARRVVICIQTPETGCGGICSASARPSGQAV